MARQPAALIIGGALSFAALALPSEAQNLPPHTIIINHWPDDVPCNVLKKYPDGTYEMTVPFVLYYQIHLSAKYRNLNVTKYWDRRCKGLTR